MSSPSSTVSSDDDSLPLLGCSIQIEPEDIAIDYQYLEDCMSRASSCTPFSDINDFPFTSLPAEIRIMIVDELVLSTLSAALASRKPIKASNFCDFSLQSHESWLVTLETLKNAVAADLDFAAQVFDSTDRLWPSLSKIKTRQDYESKESESESERDGRPTRSSAVDDVGVSEIMHAIRYQLCESHGAALLDAPLSTLRIFRRKPKVVKDRYRLAPGPAESRCAEDAWRRLYADEFATSTA